MRFPEAPRGFRAEDLLPPRPNFLPLDKAAHRMRRPASEVEDLCERGYLRCELRGGTLYVEPAHLRLATFVGPEGGAPLTAPRPTDRGPDEKTENELEPVEASARCPEHPRYRAKRRPRRTCPTCRALYGARTLRAPTR